MMKCSNIADYGLLSCDFTLFRPTHSVTLQACAFRLISMQDKLKKRTTFFFWIVNPHRTTEPWWTTSKRNFTYPTYVSLREFLSRFWVIARLLMMSLFTAFFSFWYTMRELRICFVWSGEVMKKWGAEKWFGITLTSWRKWQTFGNNSTLDFEDFV